MYQSQQIYHIQNYEKIYVSKFIVLVNLKIYICEYILNGFIYENENKSCGVRVAFLAL